MQQRSVTPGHTRSGSSHSGLGRTRRRCRILPLELWPVGSSPDRHTWADGICPHDTPPPAMGTSFLNTELWKINQIYLLGASLIDPTLRCQINAGGWGGGGKFLKMLINGGGG